MQERTLDRHRITVRAGLCPLLAALSVLVLTGPVVAGAPPPGANPGPAEERFHAVDGQLLELIGVLLAENPTLAGAWARSEASAQRAPQQRSLPDPWLGYRWFVEPPETRVGPQRHMLELNQGIPWSGKRALQAERVEHLTEGMAWEAADLERRLVAGLKRSYFEAAYLQEALAVNDEEGELLRRFESIALRRYATGQGIQQSVVKVQTDLSLLEDRRTDLARRLDLVGKRIAELIGRPEEVRVLAPIDLRLPETVPGPEEFERRATEAHPRVRAVERRIDADESWKQRRQLETKPDFRVGLGYTLVGSRDDPAGRAGPPPDDGQDVVALSVGVKIPLYRKRIRAGVAEAQDSKRAHQRALEAVRDGLRFDIRDAVAQLASLHERGKLYREVIIPQAEESLGSAEAAYATNRLGFLDLLDAERILFRSRLTYHRLVADAWIALAGLEESAGRPVGPVRSAARRDRETPKGSMP